MEQQLQALKSLAQLKHICSNEKVLYEAMNNLGYSDIYIDILCNELNKRDCKNYRIREHMYLLYAFKTYQYFLTFTFNDKALGVKAETRRQKVVRTLKKLVSEFDGLYIANIDYGSENEREHYHAVIGINKEVKDLTTYIESLYDYGFIKVKRANSNITALSKYINKFSNHCQKASVKGQSVIYSEGYTALIEHHSKVIKKYYDLAAQHRAFKHKKMHQE